jgi:hypothetical protein
MSARHNNTISKLWNCDQLHQHLLHFRFELAL